MKKRRIIKYEGEIVLGNNVIPCYVLEDGTRILSGRGMQESLKMVDVLENKQTTGTRLQRYFNQKSLEPFIYKDKEQGHYEPLECYRGNTKINGYEASILIDICDAFLEARKNIELAPRQHIIAEQCEVLVRGFARIGLIALIDEATGYQYDRERNELQKLLKAYVSEELLPWEKTFPDIYYKELFRLNGWDFTVKGIQKRPGVVGKWTKTLIYEQLPNGVFEELKRTIPKNKKGKPTAKYHQLLTEDIGNEHLKVQINEILTVFRLSDNMNGMWDNFKKIKARKIEDLELPFELDEKGHTIEQDETQLKISDIQN